MLFLAFSVDENHLALNPWLGWAENTVARGRCWPVGRTLGQSQLLMAGPWGPCEGVTLVLGGHRVALHRKRSTQHPHGLARGGAPTSPGLSSRAHGGEGLCPFEAFHHKRYFGGTLAVTPRFPSGWSVCFYRFFR